jgi:hypothetical protein
MPSGRAKPRKRTPTPGESLPRAGYVSKEGIKRSQAGRLREAGVTRIIKVVPGPLRTASIRRFEVRATQKQSLVAVGSGQSRRIRLPDGRRDRDAPIEAFAVAI